MTNHIPGGAMEEHNHEWHLIDPDDREVIKAECFWGWEESGYKIQCPATLDEVEINRRLNAVDKLSADSVVGVGVDTIHGWGEYVGVKRADWTTYIAALEKE